MSDWTSYNTGLPNVIVDQLEIVPGISKLRAATYGRGMWETDLYGSTGVEQVAVSNDAVNIFPNPTTGTVTLSTDFKQQEDLTINIVNILGETVFETKGEISAGEQNINLDISNFSKGVYFIRVNSNNVNAVKKITLIN